ncbi:MAG TPA: DarT ssDNA thymidine ADP-ribosyltransferase family protein [Galbitalea sp.]
MSDECIHGFENGMCASCNPKPVPETAVAARTPRSRTATAPRTAERTVRSLRAAARTPAGPSAVDALLQQRVYHLTHISNLAGIVGSGAIVAAATPTLELSPVELRAERQGVELPGLPDSQLGGFVPFFLSPDADQWRALRGGEPHPRISGEARAADTLDFVFLITTVRQILDAGLSFVLADGNVEGSLTRFATTREDAERMIARLRAMNDGTALQNAELLIPDRFSLYEISLIGVANDRVRTQVREILAGSDATPKISVYPPWFQPTD